MTDRIVQLEVTARSMDVFLKTQLSYDSDGSAKCWRMSVPLAAGGELWVTIFAPKDDTVAAE